MAMGHKADDHEEQTQYQQSMCNLGTAIENKGIEIGEKKKAKELISFKIKCDKRY